MAHNLEMENGEVAFALRGAPAWHNLANRIFTKDEEVTTATMLEEAKLANWNVRLSPLTDHISTEWNDVSDSHLVLRTNPFNGETDVLASVGKRYKVVQNEELFAFADNIHDANPECRWESAGSLKKGKVVFGTVDVPRTMVLDPQGANDQTKLYLIVWTSHDGSVAVQAAITSDKSTFDSIRLAVTVSSLTWVIVFKPMVSCNSNRSIRLGTIRRSIFYSSNNASPTPSAFEKAGHYITRFCFTLAGHCV